ncbi:hypothetical protein PR003_g31161 [Phytophthora rubi]|uniref:Uncharacterized protein n=1 Tax=Phytophthora rubi TaxID=129364 RepID=A0A6A4BB26_9STRA|nr:hypothetical protein PR003_g31161 [Phytophthora rubi]
MQPNDRSISTLCQLGWTNAKQTRSFMSSFLIALVFTFIATFTVDKGNTSNILSYVAAVLVLAGILMLAGIVGWVYAGHELDVSKSSMCGTFDDEGVEGYMYKKLLADPWCHAWRLCDHDLHLRPGLDRQPDVTKWAGKSPNQFGKAVTGLAIAIVGIFSGGTFEAIRRNTEDENRDPILDGGSSQPTNDITWGAAAVPNYIFIGLAECLTNVLRPRVLLGADVAQVHRLPIALGQAVILFMSSGLHHHVLQVAPVRQPGRGLPREIVLRHGRRYDSRQNARERNRRGHEHWSFGYTLG